MSLTVFDWPGVLKPNGRMIPVLSQNAASGGRSLTGTERFIKTDAGWWRFGMQVPIRTHTQVLAWRALVALTEGRFYAIRVPICDGYYDPAAVAGVRRALLAAIPDSGVTHSDGSVHSDGAGYGMALSVGTVAEAVSAGDTSITVTMPTGLRPDPGQFFSDGDRLYAIKTSTLVSGTTYLLTFLPRIRTALTAGREVSFDRLACIMQFANPDMLDVQQQLLRYSELSLEFTEANV